MTLALEVVPLPVTDIDRALAFYVAQAGFSLDVDYHPTAEFRVVQLTPPVARVSNLVSFEPDEIEVLLDDRRLALEPGQAVKEHGIDRSLDPDEILKRGQLDGPVTLR